MKPIAGILSDLWYEWLKELAPDYLKDDDA